MSAADSLEATGGQSALTAAASPLILHEAIGALISSAGIQ
jgi:hypothetical protein